MLLIVSGTKIVVYGDELDVNALESGILLLNHRCRLDWMFAWSIIPYNRLGKLKICLKKPLKHIPGFGWATQAANYIFLERNWEKDKGLPLG